MTNEARHKEQLSYKINTINKTNALTSYICGRLIPSFIDDITFQEDIEPIKKELFFYIRSMYEYDLMKAFTSDVDSETMYQTANRIVEDTKSVLATAATPGQNRNLLREDVSDRITTYSLQILEEINHVYNAYQREELRHGQIDLSNYIENIEKAMEVATPGTIPFNRLRSAKNKAELITYHPVPEQALTYGGY